MTTASTSKAVETTCCIAGGGPAGMMLGLLLARQGIAVTVLEKWPDFFRDFRGDTIHPSTMEVLRELGLLEKFLSLPHQRTPQLTAVFGGKEIVLADFERLSVAAPYIAFMPQWEFLDFLRGEAAQYPNFTLQFSTEVTDLLYREDQVVGVKAVHDGQTIEIKATLTVGADGRHSTVREKSGLTSVAHGAPIDVLWFPVPRKNNDPTASLGYIDAGQFLVLIERDTYWQCGYVIPKNEFTAMQNSPIEHFHQRLQELVPFTNDRFRFITSWEDIKLLSVSVTHMPRWYCPGLVCIGDAAHAMSPVAGVGVNLAIQDAVAAARILKDDLKQGEVSVRTLRRIERRRLWPARIIQRIQVQLHKRVILPVLTAQKLGRPALPLRLLQRFPWLRRLSARLIGIGIRPETTNY